MSTVLVTGGTGHLGKAIRPLLTKAGYTTRVMSRREKSKDAVEEWAVADVSDPASLRRAVDGVDAIIHAASEPFTNRNDIRAAQNLIDAAKDAKVNHLVYVSIIGVDVFKGQPYYTTKYEVEQMIARSGLPYSTIRAAQFHYFVDAVLSLMLAGPIAFIPKKWHFQPIAVEDVAPVYVDAVKAGPSGMLPDVGGPDILDSDTLSRSLLAARGSNKPVLTLPIPGGFSRGLRDKLNTTENAIGGIRWWDYLERTYNYNGARTYEQAAG